MLAPVVGLSIKPVNSTSLEALKSNHVAIALSLSGHFCRALDSALDGSGHLAARLDSTPEVILEVGNKMTKAVPMVSHWPDDLNGSDEPLLTIAHEGHGHCKLRPQGHPGCLRNALTQLLHEPEPVLVVLDISNANSKPKGLIIGTNPYSQKNNP
jgi:hypothetical protein